MTQSKAFSYLAILTLLVINLVLYSCKTSQPSSSRENSHNYKDYDGILVGEIPLSLIRDNYTNYEWFSKNYDKYKVKEEIVSDIKTTITEIEFDVYLGTWCGDTKRMLPKFIKILDFLKYDLRKVRFIALDKQKKGLTKIDSSLNITNVPTIIFLKKGSEINRIVENHIISLESDMKSILTDNNYINSLEY